MTGICELYTRFVGPMDYIEVARMDTQLMIQQIDEMRTDDPDDLPESSAEIASIIQRHAMHEHYGMGQ